MEVSDELERYSKATICCQRRAYVIKAVTLHLERNVGKEFLYNLISCVLYNIKM